MLQKLLIIFFIVTVTVVKGQLVTTGGISPNALVQNVLVGPGVQVSNVFFSGSASAIGTFNSANANVGIEEGIIMIAVLIIYLFTFYVNVGRRSVCAADR